MTRQVRMQGSNEANKSVQGGTHEQHVAAGRKGGLNSRGEKKKAGPNDGRHRNPGRPKGSKTSKHYVTGPND
ncbi:hypothetical protein HNV11_14600 [Spirosoma taeanense]|uniref:Uncharacterized protein n=1 Tax=Spirosoma taeanense TaxID=2735870 RepID=A0A6M5Y995_9BACT|nr:hypothetical protein [Spirosoma taeanense]QJW90519.1 hypothetical protein HNV11_14600 [Spirosoma taeanense]